MISDEDAERAIAYLRDSAKPAAKATANRYLVTEYRKIIKARIMKEHDSAPLGAQEREAYADPRYEEHLQAISAAIELDEEYQFLRQAADRKSSIWQSVFRHLKG